MAKGHIPPAKSRNLLAGWPQEIPGLAIRQEGFVLDLRISPNLSFSQIWVVFPISRIFSKFRICQADSRNTPGISRNPGSSCTIPHYSGIFLEYSGIPDIPTDSWNTSRILEVFPGFWKYLQDSWNTSRNPKILLESRNIFGILGYPRDSRNLLDSPGFPKIPIFPHYSANSQFGQARWEYNRIEMEIGFQDPGIHSLLLMFHSDI